MIILGIDPGIARMGFGVVEETKQKPRALAYGCFETSKDLAQAERLAKVHQELARLIKLHKPERVAVEKLFFSKNVKTALQVGEARGVILMTCAELKVPVFEISPKEVKQALTGYGSADKQQMQKMVQLILKLKAIPKPDDAADALAIALAGARL
ncbi:crossover junction endodeoxyribonuclease RuvC [Candidatus Uhrbacteria bacterium RIFCSPHIGHO2_12_FULL_47_11]|nr:MAG: crossover junction endodeoxyribonuclease RuvC [Candidatus Uhrbacteria bacterium RIFCSPHIGHO2_01_FULL_47_11]OGL68190.1 MAG: crossover junction endodeoxyribonuclease RuvC [Candidatus Uhrbacteria bacterium RIFCSPHIGHO2_02_FULL_46_47]OGL76031.1 MAG: crossover junction endodeoxyribonuclease RuvC [Candidatus Uhrbacteria bacterium RIFCSPHIGHO2_12_FULL_47_11]OGL83828.1 MAG: crossover junction endodeoxyribonuclease RuvC [Candidatus Uhrbacteria bacterium RIFCSPLOWO2_02_FULL_46_25]OGL92371.1 MAG: 